MQVYLTLLLQWTGYWLWAVYLSNVLPNEVGACRPWNYYLRPSYWRPRPTDTTAALQQLLADEAAVREAGCAGAGMKEQGGGSKRCHGAAVMNAWSLRVPVAGSCCCCSPSTPGCCLPPVLPPSACRGNALQAVCRAPVTEGGAGSDPDPDVTAEEAKMRRLLEQRAGGLLLLLLWGCGLQLDASPGGHSTTGTCNAGQAFCGDCMAYCCEAIDPVLDCPTLWCYARACLQALASHPALQKKTHAAAAAAAAALPARSMLLSCMACARFSRGAAHPCAAGRPSCAAAAAAAQQQAGTTRQTARTGCWTQ